MPRRQVIIDPANLPKWESIPKTKRSRWLNDKIRAEDSQYGVTYNEDFYVAGDLRAAYNVLREKFEAKDIPEESKS